ncbi:MAG: methionine adenosyltransferase [Planctomycetaceae bacterium]|nr:MAG: methionine adenosyltransferase [Planctomycetaceae bacterium]
MLDVIVESLPNIPIGRQPVEIVERKGLGHPDSICDALMESVSVALSQEYLRIAGRVLHHNLDKGLLVAGQSTPAFGGGTIETPLKIIFGDRATCDWSGAKIPVGEIAETTARRWLADNLRFLDPARHVVFQNEIRPGSPELVDIFARPELTANDTSAAVGYAPLSETERLVLAAEHYLNSPEFKRRFPESGEDVKVMGVRLGRVLHLTVAVAFVDRFVPDARTYFDRKAELQNDLQRYLSPRLRDLDAIHLNVNTLDDPARGGGGVYLTVLGTSADGADGGEVGRGNRVNGVISLNRPLSLEAAAGKNPVSHVGKIYNLLSHQIAQRICDSNPGVEEVYVWLCSQIGRPLTEPWCVSVGVIPAQGASPGDFAEPIRDIIHRELNDIQRFTGRLTRGELPVS